MEDDSAPSTRGGQTDAKAASQAFFKKGQVPFFDHASARRQLGPEALKGAKIIGALFLFVVIADFFSSKSSPSLWDPGAVAELKGPSRGCPTQEQLTKIDKLIADGDTTAATRYMDAAGCAVVPRLHGRVVNGGYHAFCIRPAGVYDCIWFAESSLKVISGHHE